MYSCPKVAGLPEKKQVVGSPRGKNEYSFVCEPVSKTLKNRQFSALSFATTEAEEVLLPPVIAR